MLPVIDHFCEARERENIRKAMDMILFLLMMLGLFIFAS